MEYAVDAYSHIAETGAYYVGWMITGYDGYALKCCVPGNVPTQNVDEYGEKCHLGTMGILFLYNI